MTRVHQSITVHRSPHDTLIKCLNLRVVSEQTRPIFDEVEYVVSNSSQVTPFPTSHTLLNVAGTIGCTHTHTNTEDTPLIYLLIAQSTHT